MSFKYEDEDTYEVLNTRDIANLISNFYPNRIAVIMSNINGDYSDTKYLLFKSEDQVMNYFAENYSRDWILYDDTGDLYIKEATLIDFNDKDQYIDFITYKNEGERYVIPNKTKYYEIKKIVMQNIDMTQKAYLTKFKL